MPVVFNEPLSFLQRISEYMEHAHLLHRACSLSDSIDRMQVLPLTPKAPFPMSDLCVELTGRFFCLLELFFSRLWQLLLFQL